PGVKPWSTRYSSWPPSATSTNSPRSAPVRDTACSRIVLRTSVGSATWRRTPWSAAISSVVGCGSAIVLPSGSRPASRSPAYTREPSTTPWAAGSTIAEPDSNMRQPGGPVLAPVGPRVDAEAPVIQYHLDGPRIGVTFMPDGAPRTQFGWHLENQAAPGTRGPWFLVERIFLVGGVERGEFIPSGTVVFGVRTPGSFEFGIGPSITLGPQGFTTA